MSRPESSSKADLRHWQLPRPVFHPHPSLGLLPDTAASLRICHLPPLGPSWHVSIPEPHPSTSPIFLFSAAASEWLFLFFQISCLLLRPWASGHLWGLVKGDSSSSRVNRCPSINHKLSETKNSQAPSLNMAQSKDGVTDSKSPGVTTPHLLTSLVLAPGFIISVWPLIRRFFKR